MWDKPQLLNALADLLLVATAAALLTAVALWAVRWPALPVRTVAVRESLRHVQREELEQVLAGRFAGNFFSVNLERVRTGVEALPWVRRVSVRRKWPSSLELSIEEHRPVARWEDGVSHAGRNEWVNSYGEIFAAVLSDEEAHRLPQVHGPTGTAPELIRRYGEFARILSPIGQEPALVRLSPRLAWQLKLGNGMLVELGREQMKSPIAGRLSRFVEAYPEWVEKRVPLPAVVDLRYRNGMALRKKG